jgi:hypothetical protein
MAGSGRFFGINGPNPNDYFNNTLDTFTEQFGLLHFLIARK